MKIFGYEKDRDDLLELEEVSLQCSIEELDKFIDFLHNVKKEHSTIVNKVEFCHSHFRDWDVTWKKGEADIIIVTEFEKII